MKMRSLLNQIQSQLAESSGQTLKWRVTGDSMMADHPTEPDEYYEVEEEGGRWGWTLRNKKDGGTIRRFPYKSKKAAMKDAEDDAFQTGQYASDYQ